MSLKAIIWVMEEAPVESHTELVVLYALADRAHDDGTAAWPSQEWTAERARCSTRTVRRALTAMEKRGVIRRGNQALTSHLGSGRRPTVWDLNMGAKRTDQVSGHSVRPTKADTGDTQSGHAGQPKRTERVTKVDTAMSYEPSGTVREPSRNRPTESLAFDTFWKSYPRKAGKHNALEKFEQQIASGASPEDLVKASENYRAETERQQTETRYIPYPSTFLNQERWRDYLKAPKASGADKRAEQIKRLESIEL